tara:strand:+ start:503 stop:1150 length:648 start_codon:yes stop_codon:yes gene_type:complete
MFNYLKGNALMIVLVLTIIIVPIGMLMMQRMRLVNYETRKIYNSFVLEHAARTGVEAVINQLQYGNFSSGPHEASISENISYVAYIDTSGIGLIGQKICHIFCRAQGDQGDSILMIATVEVYPRETTAMVIPHTFHVIEKDLFIETFAARQSLLNITSLQHEVFIKQLRTESKIPLNKYRKELLEIESKVPTEIQKDWRAMIIPEIISRKMNVRN